MDSSSVASSTVFAREGLDAERLPMVDILRKKPLLPLLEPESGARVLDDDMDGSGCCCCCCWHWGEDCKMRLGVGDGLRIDKAPLPFVLFLEHWEGAVEVDAGRGG